MSLTDGKTEAIFNKENVVVRNFLAKGDGRLFEVNLLIGGSFIIEEVIFDGDAVLPIGFEGDETIVSKEQMSDRGGCLWLL